MNRRKWFVSLALALLLTVGGIVYASNHNRGYVCPLTGETLPCEKCCPLNQK